MVPRRVRFKRALMAVLTLVVIPVSTLGFICLPVLPIPASPYAGPAPAGTFSPTVDITTSSTIPSADDDLTFTLSLAAGNLLPAGIAILIPAGWDVVSDADVVDGTEVGSISGTTTINSTGAGGCVTPDSIPASPLLDVTTDTSDGLYPAFLNVLAPGTHRARWSADTHMASGIPFFVNLLADTLAGGRTQIVVIVGNPFTPSTGGPLYNICAPWSIALTLGKSSGGGQAVFTNPPSGISTVQAVVASEWDADNDGASNALDNCPLVFNATQVDTESNGVGDACDTAPGSPDVDADGAPNWGDDCPLTSDVAQTDADLDGLGDICDSASAVPTGTQFVLMCEKDLHIGVPGAGVASCAPLLHPAVGGIAEFPPLAESSAEPSGAPADGSGWPAGAYAGLAGLGALALLAIAAGGWHVRRRRVR